MDTTVELRTMKGINRILFVCTGNSCRSIMAEAYARHRFKEEGLNIEVRSAGTLGINGMMPTKEALKILSIENVEHGKMESKALTKSLVEWADLIFVMEPHHRNAILEIMPEASEKVKFLGELNPAKTDVIIPDPIGRPLAFYRASFRMIKEPIEELISWLKK